MINTLFYQECTKADFCPECGEYLNITSHDKKVFRTCLGCGYELEVDWGWNGIEGRGMKDEGMEKSSKGT